MAVFMRVGRYALSAERLGHSLGALRPELDVVRLGSGRVGVAAELNFGFGIGDQDLRQGGDRGLGVGPATRPSRWRSSAGRR